MSVAEEQLNPFTERGRQGAREGDRSWIRCCLCQGSGVVQCVLVQPPPQAVPQQSQPPAQGSQQEATAAGWLAQTADSAGVSWWGDTPDNTPTGKAWDWGRWDQAADGATWDWGATQPVHSGPPTAQACPFAQAAPSTTPTPQGSTAAQPAPQETLARGAEISQQVTPAQAAFASKPSRSPWSQPADGRLGKPAKITAIKKLAGHYTRELERDLGKRACRTVEEEHVKFITRLGLTQAECCERIRAIEGPDGWEPGGWKHRDWERTKHWSQEEWDEYKHSRAAQ